MRAIIFANGHFPDPQAHDRLLAPDDLIVAADGGAARARSAGVTPHAVIGDLDSLEPDLRADLEAAGTAFVTYSEAKDETDLELALFYAAAQGADEIVVLAALGGRLDQTIANLLLLSHPALAGIPVRIVERNQTAFLIRDEAHIQGQPGDTVSLIPLAGDAHGVTSHGLSWPLCDETLHFGPARGVSNVLCGTQAHVRVREGTLLCVTIRHSLDHKEEQDHEA